MMGCSSKIRVKLMHVLHSREVEGSLALLDSGEELLPHDVDVGVVGQLEVVDARHDAGEVVVRRVGRLARLADHREHWGQALEA